MLEARQWAQEGWDVTLVGLTSAASMTSVPESVGRGSLTVVRVHRATYQKHKLFSRMIWTVRSNVKLLLHAFEQMRRGDSILFTGSPPLMLHFIAPLNVFLRKHLIYRIMDFHPECLIAERGRSSLMLNAVLRLTNFWRRRVHQFEVLGLDQMRRLEECGIPRDRILLKPNSSPVNFCASHKPLPLPEALAYGRGVILYSGNWGVAHDDTTFIAGYSQYARESKAPLQLWLNATGLKADRIEAVLRSKALPVFRSNLVPLQELPRLLLAADVHLVTLHDAFVGYVVPSKIHACIESGGRVLFIGSEGSEVHRLAKDRLPSDYYFRVDVGDVQELVRALHALELSVTQARNPSGGDAGERPSPAAIATAVHKQ